MKPALLVLVLCSAVTATISNPSNNEISKKPDAFWDMMDDCLRYEAPSMSSCLKSKVLHYFDGNVADIASPRKGKGIVDKIFKGREMRIELPEFFFQRATLVFSPKKEFGDFDVEFPKPDSDEERQITVARDIMKEKMLLPLLMMLKMKMKLMTPIMLTLVSIKATKALVLSKIAMFLVSAFMLVQFLKKAGMQLPLLQGLLMPPTLDHMPPYGSMTTSAPIYGAPAPAPSSAYGAPMAPSSAYGAPMPPSSVYGSPAASSYSAPSTSYGEPSTSWEPGATYSRNYDASQMAYSAYSPSASNGNTNTNSKP